jgi:hypothetical protein
MTSRDELFASLMRARCGEWPECRCGKKQAFLAEMFPQWEAQGYATLTIEEIDDLFVSIKSMLRCLAKHCPDRSIRQHAQTQLLATVFAGEAPPWPH